MNSDNELFVHKFQPLYFKDFGNDNHVIHMLKTLILLDSMNILLIGDIASGKTTILNALIREYYIGYNSKEYEELLNDKEIKKLLEQDNANKNKQLEINNKELVKQSEMKDKMVKDLNHLQTEIYKKDAIILKLSIALGVLVLIIAGYIYVRMNRLALF
jgi:predicted GTPase